MTRDIEWKAKKVGLQGGGVNKALGEVPFLN